VLRVESGLFFANADYVRAAVLAAAKGKSAVILDCETVPFVDVTAGRMLDELTAHLQDRGVRFVIAREIGQVRDVLAATGPAPEYFPSVRTAVGMVHHG
jgi:SulP family sulfate permease